VTERIARVYSNDRPCPRLCLDGVARHSCPPGPRRSAVPAPAAGRVAAAAPREGAGNFRLHGASMRPMRRALVEFQHESRETKCWTEASNNLEQTAVREQSSQPSRIDHHSTKAVLAGRRVEASYQYQMLCLTSSAARSCMPLQPAQPRRGSTPHASRRWRRGGPFTVARRRPSAAHRHDADRSCPRPRRHRSRPTRLLQASRSAATASTHRVASAAAPRAVETALGRRSRSFTSGSAKTSRRGPKRLKIQKETTHRHDSRKRSV
jgi:hypothetical protein